MISDLEGTCHSEPTSVAKRPAWYTFLMLKASCAVRSDRFGHATILPHAGTRLKVGRLHHPSDGDEIRLLSFSSINHKSPYQWHPLSISRETPHTLRPHRSRHLAAGNSLYSRVGVISLTHRLNMLQLRIKAVSKPIAQEVYG